MLQETETEETIDFFVAFLSLASFRLGGRAPRPPGYAYAPNTDLWYHTSKDQVEQRSIAFLHSLTFWQGVEPNLNPNRKPE